LAGGSAQNNDDTQIPEEDGDMMRLTQLLRHTPIQQ
jgi:hypothetical protein